MDEDGKKDAFIPLDNCWKWKWGCGLHYNVETIWFPDFGDYVLVPQEKAPILGKTHGVFSVIWQMWGGFFVVFFLFCFVFTIIKSFLHILSYWKVNYFSKQPCQYHKRKSDQTGLKLCYRGQELPRRSSREVVMLIALEGVHMEFINKISHIKLLEYIQ